MGPDTHKEVCKRFCIGSDKSTPHGGPIPTVLFSTGNMGKEDLDLNMKNHTASFLDEICRCNDATREILRLDVAIISASGSGSACIQAFATFRDDQLNVHTENFMLFKPLTEEPHIQDMINDGCGDVPYGIRKKVMDLLTNFFTEALDREIKIREMVCLRATLWLLQERFIDPKPEERCSFDPPFGPVVVTPHAKYLDYVPGFA